MIDLAAITLADPRWETSYPNVPVLRAGQSLPGYCLELDRANDLDPGFTFRVIRRSGTGPAHLAAPGKWLSAFLLDLDRLASLTARPRVELERHTARPLMRWLYPARADPRLIGGHLLGQRPSFALCPRCMESGDLPLASLFALTAGCPRHGLQLQSACATHIRVGHGGLEPCATPITLFSGGDRFYACPRLECGASYAALPQMALGRDALTRVQRLTLLLGELLARAATGTPLAPGFGEPLRGKILPSDLPSGRATALASALRAPRPSLPALIDGLLVTATSVDEWIGELRRPWTGVRRKVVGREQQRLPPLFPSPRRPTCPSCTGTNCYRNGRAATLDRSQEFICKRCGTRFTRQQVLFSFDPHPRYRAVLAGRNQRRLDAYRTAVTAAVSRWPSGVPMTRTAVFARAGVPRAISYTTRRAGLMQVINATHATATSAPRRPRPLRRRSNDEAFTLPRGRRARPPSRSARRS